MAKGEILIRRAISHDLNSIFYLYANYMFDSYLLKFSNAFVKKYLKIIINSRNCITLVSEKDSLVGFIMATFDSKKIIFELILNIEILCAWIKEVLAHPVLALKSTELFFYPFKAYLKNVKAEFLFIAIEPVYRKINIATELIRHALNLMNQKGIRKIKVSTISENEAVNSLLKKLGFKVEKTFMQFKKPMYLYSYTYSPLT